MWRVSRQLVYRALDRLVALGLAAPAGAPSRATAARRAGSRRHGRGPRAPRRLAGDPGRPPARRAQRPAAQAGGGRRRRWASTPPGSRRPAGHVRHPARRPGRGPPQATRSPSGATTRPRPSGPPRRPRVGRRRRPRPLSCSDSSKSSVCAVSAQITTRLTPEHDQRPERRHEDREHRQRCADERPQQPEHLPDRVAGDDQPGGDELDDAQDQPEPAPGGDVDAVQHLAHSLL